MDKLPDWEITRRQKISIKMKLLRATSLPAWNKGKTKADDPRIEKLAVWKGKENLKKRTRVKANCTVCNKPIERTPSQIKADIKNHCSSKCANVTKSRKTKGRPFPEEQKKLLSALKKGKPLHPAVLEGFKKKFPDGRFGELSGNWKGGVTPENHRIRTSEEYKQWAKAVKERDNYTCQDCGQRGGILHSDHRKSFAYFPDLRFNLDNGRTLCIDCHKKTDNYMGRATKFRQT